LPLASVGFWLVAGTGESPGASIPEMGRIPPKPVIFAVPRLSFYLTPIASRDKRHV
jgi:hypothetical protein